MIIPEVTERQVALMQTVCHDPDMSVFSQCLPKPTDDLQVAVLSNQAHEDAEYLCTLGFLKNITEDHREQIDKMEIDTGRTWNVYQIPAIGRAMFQAACSTTAH